MNAQPIYVLAPRHWKGSAYMTMNLTCLGYYFRKQIHKPIFISILGWARQIWSCHIHKFTWNFFRESGPNQRNVRLNEVPLVEGLLGWNRASPQETSTIINFKQFRNFFFFFGWIKQCTNYASTKSYQYSIYWTLYLWLGSASTTSYSCTHEQ